MIQISNLTKIYKSKKKNSHKALDNLNLSLPNTGLVFVIGKSGSGKSTLLNLLGGLDNITSGNIIVDGNDITKFKETDLSNYRNNHIGFIFQDYHLLDELTVYENIVLSLNLNRLDDNDKVKEALEKVGLSGYENRYPTELSGGERQRIAIARAIVKKPYVILADEPTGNLDNETGTQIISLLKELSNECLILIVSHNTIDTYKYADRIIKLSNGKIISDEARNPEYLDNISCVDNILYYPMDKTLNEEDISVINKKEFTKIVGKNDKYITTYNNDNKERNIKIDKKNLSIKNVFKLCLTFLKSKVFRITASSFMIAVIMVILALSQTIITFDAGKIIKDETDKIEQTDFFMKKFISEEESDQLGKKVYVEVTEGDINEFRHAGYKGDIYEVMNFTLPISLSVNFAGWSGPVLSNSIYLKETLGLLIIDDNFLVNKIGKLEYIEKVDEFCDEGVIITDYVADSMLMNNSKFNARTYKDLLGKYYYSSTTNTHVRGYINGIIKTNYKETYKQLFEIVNNNKAINFNELYKNKEFINFTNDIYSYLGFTYSFNENFKECFNKTIGYGALWHYSLRINQIDFNNLISPQIWKGEWAGYNLKENEVIMNYERYNEIFGTNYNLNNLDTFMPHEIKLEQYRYFDTERKNILMSLDLKITCLKDKGNYTFMVSDDVYNKFKENMLINIGLYFEGNEDLDKVINIGNELGYEHTTFIVEGIHTMTKAVDVFIPIFELVAIVLCAGIVFILISFSTKMIKDKIHDIGILKALGCKNCTIGIIFGLQLLLIALCTIILSTIGYFFFIDLANDVLIESLKILAPSHIVLDLDFLTFKINVVGVNSLLVILLTIVSFIIPMLKIYNIKPVQIIKTKE